MFAQSANCRQLAGVIILREFRQDDCKVVSKTFSLILSLSKYAVCHQTMVRQARHERIQMNFTVVLRTPARLKIVGSVLQYGHIHRRF